jgi:spermidine synthase
MGKKGDEAKQRGTASATAANLDESAGWRTSWLPERSALRLLVFVAGIVLMGLEIAGSRVLAPHFGNSVFVWGSLISVFLIALAVGYYIGGRLADRQPSMRLLSAILVAAAIWIFALASTGHAVCEAVGNGGFGLVTGPLVASALLFLPPSVALGIVSPFAVRIAATSLGSVGQTAGTLYALSTLGSIVGTLLTTFGLIPLIGVTAILRSLGAALLLVSLVALPSFKTRLGSLALWIIFLAMVAGSFYAQPPHLRLDFGETLLALESTPYHDISVVDNRPRNSRQLRFGRYAETSISLTPLYPTQDKYTSYFHLAFLARPEMERVLFIGAGGGVGPRSFLAHNPHLKIDVVDVDQRVLDLASDFFYLPKSLSIQLFAEDGRMFLRRADTKYDFIVLDAFTIGGRIPFHLVTRESLELCREHLTPNGVFVMNFGSTREGPRSGIYRTMLPTAAAVFANVYVFAVDQHTVDPQNTTNFILLASDDKRVPASEWLARAERYQSESYVKAADVTKMVGDLLAEQPPKSTAPIFTDDYAPIEMMAY